MILLRVAVEIDHGIAIADSRRYGIVDHVTARRLAIWLAARPQEQVFTQGLARFADTGFGDQPPHAPP